MQWACMQRLDDVRHSHRTSRRHQRSYRYRPIVLYAVHLLRDWLENDSRTEYLLLLAARGWRPVVA
jgi:hypothetical protein